ncbi:MAG TPA: ACT domain-containing protein [Verrucomicrobiae bacterium]|nr:ACT domain-containing protein [Verrucomicrobiae bacterium]
MKWKQLSVFLENKPGALNEPCRLLAKAGINVQTFSLADTREFGILRLVVGESDRARRLLQRNGFAVKVTKVVVIEVPDRPGALAGILDAIEGTQVSVKYAYGFTVKPGDKGVLVFSFDEPDSATRVLLKKGFKVL